MRKDLKRKANKVANYSLALSLVGTGVGVTSLVTPTHAVLAVKNHEGVCQVETKTGEITFNAQSTTVETTKPVDLLLIADGSGSIDAQYMYMIIHMSKALVDSLPAGSNVMIATYARNETDSYQGTPTRMLTKAEAQSFFNDIITKTGDSILAYDYNTVRDQVSNYVHTGVNSSGPYEDVFARDLKQGNTTSVIQFTDGWDDGEDIDRSFAAWSKANAKTFMSVLINGKPGISYDKMIEVGHPNIYATGQPAEAMRNLGQINQEIITQFRDTATEKITPKGRIQVNAPQGVTLKEVKLVAPDGKEEVLPITNNQVNVEKDLSKDGNYKVKVKADGLVPENRKVTMSATVGGGQPVTGEILFEGCKDDVKGTKEEKENVDIPFETKYEDTEDLPAGETKVKREGVVGIKEIKRVWNTVNGVKQGDPKVTESIVKDKVDKIVLRGTQQKKTVYYRIVDPKDKVIKDNTKVSDGYKGAKYTVTKPTLAGYEIELKAGMHESGTLEGRDVIVDYVAYKLGKGVNARFVDEDGKELKAGVKIKDAGLRNGTKYGIAPEPVLEKDGLKYVYSTLGKGSAPANGEIGDNEQVVTFVYKKAEGKSVRAEFVKKDTADKLIDDLIIKPEGTQVGTPWSSSHKNELMKDGLVYVVDAGLPVESGKVTDMEQVLKYNYVAKIGQPVKVRYMADNLEISGMEVVSENAQVGSGYEKEVVSEIKKDGKLYRFVGLEKVEEGMKPKADEPKGDEPKLDAPKGNEPKGEKPTDGKPTDEKPTDGKPAGVKPNEDSKPKDGEAPKADTPKADEPKATEGDVIEVDSKSEIKDRQFKGIVNNHEQVYVAKYVEVKPAPIKVNFVDENGKELKAGINLLKADTLLDSDYKYDAEKRIKVGDDEYALVGVTLDGKDVKEIKGKFGEKEQVYTAKYKKVVKPAPAKLPKTSGVEGYAKTQVATGLTVMGILGLILSFFGYRRKVNK
jgi:hypothetical protein